MISQKNRHVASIFKKVEFFRFFVILKKKISKKTPYRKKRGPYSIRYIFFEIQKTAKSLTFVA